MTWPPTWTSPQFKGEEPSRLETRRKKVNDREANWRTVARQVDRRDNYRCRACGTSTNTDSLDPLEKGHRHHLTFRSKGGQDVASNLVTLCPRCHDAVHVKRSLRIEAQTAFGADGALSFWRTLNGEEFLSRREITCGQVERD